MEHGAESAKLHTSTLMSSSKRPRKGRSLIWRLIPDLILLLVTHWPGPLGNWLRYRYYRKRLKHLGHSAVLDVGVHFVNPELISIGDRTHIDRHVTIIAGVPHRGARKLHMMRNPAFQHQTGEVVIGAQVHIAPYAYILGCGGVAIGDRSCLTSNVRLFSISHHHMDPEDPENRTPFSFSNRVPEAEQVIFIGPVVLAGNNAVGLNSVVLPGSTLGQNTWVGAMSLVKGILPENVIAVGCPARVLKERPS